MSTAKKNTTVDSREIVRERNALLKCVERMADELDRLGPVVDDTITEDGRNTVRWCKVRELQRRKGKA